MYVCTSIPKNQGWIVWPSQTRNILLKSVSGVEISTEREFTLNFFVCGPISTQFFSAESQDQEGHVTKYAPLVNQHGLNEKASKDYMRSDRFICSLQLSLPIMFWLTLRSAVAHKTCFIRLKSFCQRNSYCNDSIPWIYARGLWNTS